MLWPHEREHEADCEQQLNEQANRALLNAPLYECEKVRGRDPSNSQARGSGLLGDTRVTRWDVDRAHSVRASFKVVTSASYL